MIPIPPTPRLYFRPFEAADAAGMLALDSDPAVHRYLGGIGGFMATTLAESAATIEFIQAQYQRNGIGRWAVLERGSGEFVGWAGLKFADYEINGHRDFYDIGYRFRPQFWGQGYGYEAAQAWLDYGFGTMQVPKICGYADVNNAASCRILAKIGLVRENDFDENGTRCAWFAGQRKDWQTKPGHNN